MGDVQRLGFVKVGDVRLPYALDYHYCPTDPGHWRVDRERCPVCKAKIAVERYERAAPREERRQ